MATADEERPLSEAAATSDDASSSQHCNLKQSRVCALTLAIVGLAVLLGGVFTSKLTLKILDDSLTDGLVVASQASIGYKAWQSNTK